MHKVLSFFVHEGWETNWAKTDNTFYMTNSPERRDGWKHNERPIPNNYVHVDFNVANELAKRGEIDVVVCHTPIEQRKVGESLKKAYDLPLIEMNHCLPFYLWKRSTIDSIRRNSIADLHVFTTEQQAVLWGYDPDDEDVHICGHTVDTDIFKNRYHGELDAVLSVGYDFKGRGEILGYNTWDMITKGFNRLHIGDGEDETLATASELAEKYYLENRLFINTAHHSTLPTSMLEAMACGMPVVSVVGPGNDKIFKNETNGFISSDPLKLREYVYKLTSDIALAHAVGMKGYLLFQELFAPRVFIDNWNNIFNIATKG